MIERSIVIGLITSTEYLQALQPIWDSRLLTTSAARMLANWCWEYFNKYGKAPQSNIETIFYQKLKDGLNKDLAEDMEEDLLPGLSEEYENEKFNVDYLLDQTRQYFRERRVRLHSEGTINLLDQGKVDQAEQQACEYNPLPVGSDTDLDLGSEETLGKLENAFIHSVEPLVKYPKQLGTFWNDQLIRDGFIAFMASEKRGKTFWLIDFAVRACKQKCRVAFFQAGDMSENQFLLRIAVYLTKISNKEKYCVRHWEPVRDCLKNQLNECDKPERECDFGVFDNMDEIRKVTLEQLIEAYKKNPDYKPCWNCKEYENKRWGTPWIQPIPKRRTLSFNRAKTAWKKFFIENKFKLSTHPNDTLTVPMIRSKLSIWEREGFVPDVIIIDYADILTTEISMEERPKQNKIWKQLRSLSQERHCLVVTATQADAKSYESGLLHMKNFSEDKRKYGHVTAMYGLNQDKDGREKNIGLMRINEIVLREGDYNTSKTVTVLQNLRRGRPFLGSFNGI